MKKRVAKLWQRLSAKKPSSFVFVHNQQVEIDGKKSVVLSPAFYWYKKSDYKISSLFKAKKLAKSVFAGMLTDGNFSYFAFKENDSFGFIACDVASVFARLEELGVAPHQIDKIYFAQRVFADTLQPIAIDEKSVLIRLNGSLVVLDKSLASGEAITTDQAVLHPPYLAVRDKNTLSTPQKPLMILSALLASFVLFLSLEVWQTSQEAREMESKKEELLSKNRLPATMMQIESINKRLESKAKTQRNLRENLSKITTTKSAKIETIRYEADQITVIFGDADQRAKFAKIPFEYKTEGNQTVGVIRW